MKQSDLGQACSINSQLATIELRKSAFHNAGVLQLKISVPTTLTIEGEEESGRVTIDFANYTSDFAQESASNILKIAEAVLDEQAAQFRVQLVQLGVDET